MWNDKFAVKLSTVINFFHLQTREINLNVFGDEYISFIAMHISFSPDGKYILVSTGMSSKDCQSVIKVKNICTS